MKMRLTSICLALVATSCATRNLPEGAPSGGAWSVEESALSWLKTQQQADGHWGTAEHRVELTSLATLAFLSRGETPASDEYGKTVENALRALLRDAESKSTQDGGTAALLTWCLAEAYGMTRIPVILDTVRVQAAELDFSKATPWLAFAAQALLLSGSCPQIGKQGIATMSSEFPSRTNNILNQATHAFLAMRAGDRKHATPYLEAVRQLSPADWRAHESPLPSAVMVSTALLWAGGKDSQEWHRTFYADVISRQTKQEALGWWTAEDLGLTTKQLPTLGGSEKDIYVTCMVFLTFPPPRFLPMFEHAEPSKQETDDGEEIKIDIR